ncbi:MAG: sigma 54-interacting transcriptional regulator [Burkholderiaceae bacterium]|nr:sigma 54-interacting transcriptional regulator [Burkholderiaceae bacterium]
MFVDANDPIAEALASGGAQSLLQRLHFNASEGRIWLDDRRMLLLDVAAFTGLRMELIELLGTDVARGVFTRVGYLMGARDAALACKLHDRDASLANLFAPGPFLHALEGFVHVQSLRREMDIEAGHCNCEFLMKNSAEHASHTSSAGIAASAECWTAVGHTSAYFSHIMGKRILVREVECEASGDPRCRAIARPVEQWDDAEEDLRYFTLEHRTQAPSRRKTFLPAAIPARGESPDSRVVGSSHALSAVLHKVRRVADTNATVLLLGESGVGKSLFAHEIHQQSKRADKPFVAVNCAAIPEPLIESELFGVERGAYSGASAARPGRFEAAHGGTIFLDEIGTLTPPTQAKLLRVLQSGEIERLGSNRTVQINARILAATNEDLKTAVLDGRFREDLYYRVNVFPIQIPPLRDRRDDLPLLLQACIGRFTREHGRRCPGVTPALLKAVVNYHWPGNVRELENVIERAIILAEDGEPLDVRHLFSVDMTTRDKALVTVGSSGRLALESGATVPTRAAGDPGSVEASLDFKEELRQWAWSAVMERKLSLPSTLEWIKSELMQAALQQTRGNVSKAASMIGVTRAQMDYQLRHNPTH